ncbi:MAG TPA: hypothetical protein VMV24_01000 [Candidatus Dormibacteraeota bacterium]|nr:hypothetical protein [Candidatus Dormibacteraeota bacterium]
MSYIISADELKKGLPGYSPEKSEAFHHDSARLADKQFTQAMKKRPESLVILMSGGTASGKSEYVSAYLANREAIVLDGTLPTFAGAEIKIKKTAKGGKIVEIHCVLPENFIIAFVAFLNRDRKFPSSHFFGTHSSTRKTVLKIAEEFPDIPIKIIISRVDQTNKKTTMNFREVEFMSRDDLIEFLHHEQYTEEDIKRTVFKKYDN